MGSGYNVAQSYDEGTLLIGPDVALDGSPETGFSSTAPVRDLHLAVFGLFICVYLMSVIRDGKVWDRSYEKAEKRTKSKSCEEKKLYKLLRVIAELG